MLICWWSRFVIAVILLQCKLAKSNTDLSWPGSTAIENSYGDSRVLGFEQDVTPEAKHLHKVKKLKKKLLLLCLLGGNGRRKRSVPVAEGKFFFPVIQHTDVNVGGSGTGGHLGDSSESGGSHGGFDCKNVLGSGLGNFGHPIISSLLGGGGGSSSPSMMSSDENRFYRRTIQRNVVRPLYQSMKHMYRLFK